MAFINRKYPFRQRGGWLLIRESIIYGVVIWAILFLLQPFGFSQYQGNKFLVALMFGLVTTCCYAFYGWLVLIHVVRRVNPWRVWHHGCAFIGLVLFIAVCNYLFFSYIFHYPLTLGFFLLFLYWTILLGLILTAASISLAYNRFLRDKMEMLLSNTTEEQKDILITIHDTNVRANDLCIPINSLLYMEARKNNVAVCYMKDGKPETVEVHTTLTAAMEALKDYENIFQCHRSFVVNVNNITAARGNSNGYQLTLGTSAVTIPVARSYVPKLKAFIA